MYTHTVNTCCSANVNNFRTCKQNTSSTLQSEMPKKANEIAVKWLELTDAGKINHVKEERLS